MQFNFYHLQITLSRAMSALSFWQKVKLGWHLLTTKDPIRYVHKLVYTHHKHTYSTCKLTLRVIPLGKAIQRSNSSLCRVLDLCVAGPVPGPL